MCQIWSHSDKLYTRYLLPNIVDFTDSVTDKQTYKKSKKKTVGLNDNFCTPGSDNNNTDDIVYGAVISWMQTWAPDGRQPSDQANRLGLWVRQ